MKRLNENYGIKNNDDLYNFSQEIRDDAKIIISDFDEYYYGLVWHELDDSMFMLYNYTTCFEFQSNEFDDVKDQDEDIRTMPSVKFNPKNRDKVKIGFLGVGLEFCDKLYGTNQSAVDGRKLNKDTIIADDIVFDFFNGDDKDSFVGQLEDDYQNKIKLVKRNDLEIKKVNPKYAIGNIYYDVYLLDF